MIKKSNIPSIPSPIHFRYVDNGNDIPSIPEPIHFKHVGSTGNATPTEDNSSEIPTIPEPIHFKYSGNNQLPTRQPLVGFGDYVVKKYFKEDSNSNSDE